MTVQGPVKEQQQDGMSHRGPIIPGGLGWGVEGGRVGLSYRGGGGGLSYRAGGRGVRNRRKLEWPNLAQQQCAKLRYVILRSEAFFRGVIVCVFGLRSPIVPAHFALGVPFVRPVGAAAMCL